MFVFSIKNKISFGVEAPEVKVIKLFMAVIRSKVECLSLAGLSNLVYFLRVKREHIQVKHFRKALPTNIIIC